MAGTSTKSERFALRIPLDLARELREAAARNGRSMAREILHRLGSRTRVKSGPAIIRPVTKMAPIQDKPAAALSIPVVTAAPAREPGSLLKGARGKS